jgi:hypothetical protein
MNAVEVQPKPARTFGLRYFPMVACLPEIRIATIMMGTEVTPLIVAA